MITIRIEEESSRLFCKDAITIEEAKQAIKFIKELEHYTPPLAISLFEEALATVLRLSR